MDNFGYTSLHDLPVLLRTPYRSPFPLILGGFSDMTVNSNRSTMKRKNSNHHQHFSQEAMREKRAWDKDGMMAFN